MVVKHADLFQEDVFEGFLSHEENSFLDRILTHYEYKERNDELEKNMSFKQPIPYIWIVNPASKKIFVYQRAAHKGYPEKRLHGKWSAGIGCHINRATEEFSENPIEDAMIRGLREEIMTSIYPDPQIIGFLHLTESEVDKVHFGIVAVAEVTDFVEKGGPNISQGKFYSMQEFDEFLANSENDVENWTRVSWPFVKQHLTDL